MSTGSTTVEAGSVRFSRDVMWTMGVRLMIVASSVLSGIIVARWLGAGAVGVLAALGVVTMLAITVGSVGLASSITFTVARDKGRARAVLVPAVVFGIVSGSVLAASLIAGALFHPQLLGEVPPTLVMVVAAAVPVQMVTAFCLAVYLGLEKIRTYNLIDLVLQAVILVNAVIALIIVGAGLYSLVIFTAVANVLVGAIVLFFLDRGTRTGQIQETDRPLVWQLFRTGSKFFVAMGAGLIILRGDILIVNYFRGTEEAGVYAVATQIATFLHMIPNVISTILFPRTAGAAETSGTMTCRVTRHSVFIMAVLCLMAIPLAFLVPMVYGQAFAAVPMLFLILLPGVFLLGIETIQVQYFNGIGLPRIIPVFWIGVMLLNLAINFSLVPTQGAYGAAIASSVSYAVIFVLVATYFRVKTGLGLAEALVPQRGELATLFMQAKSFHRREDNT